MQEVDKSIIKSEDELKDFILQTPYMSDDCSYDVRSHFVDINNTIGKIDDDIKLLCNAESVMKSYDINYDVEAFNNKIQFLIDSINELRLYRVVVKNILLDKQSTCDHDEKYLNHIGHDHNYDYYKCKLCGKDIKQ